MESEIQAKHVSFNQMMEAQQKSDIIRANASLSSIKNFRIQSDKYYKDKADEQKYNYNYVYHYQLITSKLVANERFGLLLKKQKLKLRYFTAN
jgi:hypothetical protein